MERGIPVSEAAVLVDGIRAAADSEQGVPGRGAWLQPAGVWRAAPKCNPSVPGGNLGSVRCSSRCQAAVEGITDTFLTRINTQKEMLGQDPQQGIYYGEMIEILVMILTHQFPAQQVTRTEDVSAPAPTQGPTSAGAGGPPPATKRLQQTQAQVDEVVDIMRMNVDKVLERDQMLSELDNRADALQAGASQFETSAAKLKRKYWWKNCKMMIILGVVCAVILIIIISE
ncbi:hypothetical protein AAES_121035 [Amazona aestiva]|uniref:V-SNARE coiled-coil homology domain-containing protein n=1 Tax=Amazona aestiva TaxID=12930 RepID=A0A0Q3M5L9_AMAAE|nr:hypothetical protein AAES_121035 [Amazona aestiva]